MNDDIDEEIEVFPLKNGKYDPAFHVLCDDTFDEKSFLLELRVEDVQRRRLATQTMHLLQRLARLRARNENATTDDVWPDILDRERLSAERIGSNERAASLAGRIMKNLVDLAILREDQSPYNLFDRKRSKKGGRRAA